MKNIERKDLVSAVLESRDTIDPELDTELLEDVVDAESDSAGDGDAAIRAIDAAVTAAIVRGVGYVQETSTVAASDDNVNGEGEDQEDEALC